MVPITASGLIYIKQVELATKWRKFIPTKFQDDVCPIPNSEVVEAVWNALSVKNANKRKTAKGTDTTVSEIIDTDALIGDETIIKKLKVIDLKKQLGMRKLPKQGNKNVLIDRLLETIQSSMSTTADQNKQETTVMAVSESVDTSHNTNTEGNDQTDTVDI